MTSMTVGATVTNMAYNGDGARVSREVVGVGTTYYIGNHYEVYKPNGGSATTNKYYYFGTTRVAARINGTLFYMQGDHLGSSSLVMTTSGTLNTRQTYFPYGAKRVADGSPLPTGMDTTFTGQKSDDSTGLMYYGARYYDTGLGRFTQADTIVPNPMNPQTLNRYSYTANNPVRYTDPTGHAFCEDCNDGGDYNDGGDTGGDAGGGNGCGANDADCDGVTDSEDQAPADTGGNQYPNGKECWPHCNDNSGTGSDVQRLARGKCPGFCRPPQADFPDNPPPPAVGGPQIDVGGAIRALWSRLLAALGIGAAACEANPAACSKTAQTYTFRSKELLEAHQKHLPRLGIATLQEYEAAASDLISRGMNQAGGIAVKIRGGDRLFFEAQTERFAVLSKDGFIRTMYKPDFPLEYWMKQPGQLQ